MEGTSVYDSLMSCTRHFLQVFLFTVYNLISNQTKPTNLQINRHSNNCVAVLMMPIAYIIDKVYISEIRFFYISKKT